MSIDALNWALNRAPVSDSTQAFVLVCLADYADPETHFCWPSIARVAARARCSESTARRAIRELEKAGLIVTKMAAARGGANLYRVVMREPSQIDTPATYPQIHSHDRQPSPAKKAFVHRHADKVDHTPVNLQGGQIDTLASTPPSPVTDDRAPLAPVTPEPPMNHQEPPAAPGEQPIHELEKACRDAGLSARFDRLTAVETATIETLILANGIPVLVASARSHHRADNPARYARAWVPSWLALPTPRSSSSLPSWTPCGDCDANGWIETTDGVTRCQCHPRSVGGTR